jgi:hypothetical protein
MRSRHRKCRFCAAKLGGHFIRAFRRDFNFVDFHRAKAPAVLAEGR